MAFLGVIRVMSCPCVSDLSPRFPCSYDDSFAFLLVGFWRGAQRGIGSYWKEGEVGGTRKFEGAWLRASCYISNILLH